MKKAITILLIFACVFSLFGCDADQEELKKPVTVYYKRAQMGYGASDSVIATYALEAVGHETDTTFLFQEYLHGPDSSDFSTTFPSGTALISYQLEGLTAKVVLSDQFATLTGIDLSVACACLSKTIMSLTDCREVIIRAEHAQLDNNNFITISSNSYLLQDLISTNENH